MRRCFIAWLIATAAVGCDAPAPSARAPSLAHLGDCPYSEVADWQSFLEREARGEPWTTTCDDGGCDSASVLDVETKVADVFQRCAGFLADNPPLDACAKNLRRFSAAWMEQHDALSYGFTTSNADYFAAQEAPGVPEGMMTPPAALLAGMPSLDKVEETARAMGWPYVLQTSCLGSTRLFVMSPDAAGRFDQWTLMNVREGTSPVEVNRRVSFLAVQKAEASGKSLEAVRVHFRDYLVSSSAEGGATLTSDSTDNAKCYSCHASGVRRLIGIRTPSLDAKPVLGEPGYTDDGALVPADFPFQRLTSMNDRLGSYGSNDWNGTIIVADHGPALGKEQGCTACHDGVQRGVLTVSTSQKQLREKVRNELAMPPAPGLTDLLERETMNDPHLDPGEQMALEAAESAHAALLDGVVASSGPALEAWLLETSCE